MEPTAGFSLRTLSCALALAAAEELHRASAQNEGAGLEEVLVIAAGVKNACWKYQIPSRR